MRKRPIDWPATMIWLGGLALNGLLWFGGIVIAVEFFR
jgi:hypothetical protein